MPAILSKNMEQNPNMMNKSEIKRTETRFAHTTDLESLKEFIQSVQDERNKNENLFKPGRLQDLRQENSALNKHSYGLG